MSWAISSKANVMNSIFSVSNIAWKQHDDPAIFRLLSRYGVNGIEIAPSKLWDDLERVTSKQASEYRSLLADSGFRVPALQSIFYGCPHLQVFLPETRGAVLKRIHLIAKLASNLGAEILVFGAPKNRRRNGMEYSAAFEYACDVFREAGRIASEYGCAIGIEANAADYQCDFLTNTADAERFVMAVDSPGVVLHVDSGTTALTHERIGDVLTGRKVPVRHYHISEPMLENPGLSGKIDHAEAFRALKAIRYAGAVSIEMKMQEPDRDNLETALQFIAGVMNDVGF